MKKYFILLAVALVVTFTACNKDDDDDDKPTDVTTAIAGEYTGDISLLGSVVAEDVVIALTREDDTHMTISMNETIEVSLMVLPLDVQCENALVTLSGQTYTISGETVVELDLGTGLTEYNVSISGTVKNDVADLAISINMGIVPITVQFTGTKNNGSEPEPDPTNYAAAIAGDYVGNITSNGNIVAPGATIQFVREDNTHVTIAMNEMVTIAPEVTVPINVQCGNATVNLNNSIYTVAGEVEQEITFGLYTGPFEINIEGDVTDNTTALTITITSIESVEIPPIVAQFTGDKTIYTED